MAKFIKVLKRQGAVRDCTVGKEYPVEQEVEAGGNYDFNGRVHNSPVDGYVITDDVGDSVALRAVSDADENAWELVVAE